MLITVIILIAIAAGLFYFLPFGKIKAQIIRSATSRVFKTFSCGCISLSPFRVEKFEVRTFGSLIMPEVGISWDLLEINTYFNDWLHMNFDNKLIVVALESIHFDIPALSFADILNPPDNPPKPSGSPLSVMHKLALCFELKIFEITMHLNFPDIKSNVDLCATFMLLHFELNDKDSQALVAAVTFENSHVLVTIDNEESVEYAGEHARMKVSLNIPTGMMNADIKLSGSDTTTVQTQRFLEFFGYFNTADDNSIEIKMAWGMPTGGKMQLMQVHFEEMMLFMTDRRSTVHMVMVMQDVCASLATVRLPQDETASNGIVKSYNSKSSAHVPHSDARSGTCEDDFEDGVDEWVSDLEGSDMQKTISISMKHIQFVGQQGCAVSGVSVVIKKTVVNSGNYTDHEDMTVEVDQVIFPWIDKLFLEWLLIAQHVADIIPNSRFAHTKSANMTAKINLMQMALSPVDYKHDQSVRFTFHELSVVKIQQARDETSNFSLNLVSLDVLVSRPYLSMQDRFTVHFDEDQQNLAKDFTMSVQYKVMDLSTTFSIGGEFQLHTVRILELHIVEDTHKTLSQVVMPSRIVPLFRVASINILATANSMEISMGRMTATMGFASILKCLCTFDMVMNVQDKISDTMDLIKIAIEPLYNPPHLQLQCPADFMSLTPPGIRPEVKPEKMLTFKWAHLELTLALDLPIGHSNSASESTQLFLSLRFADLLYSTHEETKQLEFPSLAITSNGANQYEFITIGKFRMHSGKKMNTHRCKSVDSKHYNDVTVRLTIFLFFVIDFSKPVIQYRLGFPSPISAWMT